MKFIVSPNDTLGDVLALRGSLLARRIRLAVAVSAIDAAIAATERAESVVAGIGDLEIEGLDELLDSLTPVLGPPVPASPAT